MGFLSDHYKGVIIGIFAIFMMVNAANQFFYLHGSSSGLGQSESLRGLQTYQNEVIQKQDDFKSQLSEYQTKEGNIFDIAGLAVSGATLMFSVFLNSIVSVVSIVTVFSSAFGEIGIVKVAVGQLTNPISVIIGMVVAFAIAAVVFKWKL